MWEVIQWGYENDYQVFDWGKTDLKNEGLRNFKCGLGSEESVLHYYYLGDVNSGVGLSNERVMKMARNLFSKMPLGMLQFIGNRIYKYAA